MDKSKLYYLVKKGTNIQAMATPAKRVVIVEEDAIDRVAENWPQYEKITIEEYEVKYVVGLAGGKSGKN